jgi:hypothetical protein
VAPSRSRPRLGLLSAPLLLALAACGEEPGPEPLIDDVLPAAAGRGELVVIIGDRFCAPGPLPAADDLACAAPPAALVSFGGQAEVVRARTERYGQRRISLLVPDTAPPGATTLVVLRAGVASRPVDFEVLE